MGIYFKDRQKEMRWDSSLAVLHKDNQKTDEKEKTQKTFELKNTYGSLNYRKKGEKRGQEKEGFALEALEAPGTPVHTEKEKQLDRSSMKKVNTGGKEPLYTSETPLRSQALFYEMSGSKKSESFVKCMKKIIQLRGHQTLKDTFGFLDQEPERLALKAVKTEQNALLPEEFDRNIKHSDTLSSRLLRKEAKERQMCSQLQVMLNERTKEERKEEHKKHWQELIKEQKNRKKTADSSIIRQTASSAETAAGAENTLPQEEDSVSYSSSQ